MNYFPQHVIRLLSPHNIPFPYIMIHPQIPSDTSKQRQSPSHQQRITKLCHQLIPLIKFPSNSTPLQPNTLTHSLITPTIQDTHQQQQPNSGSKTPSTITVGSNCLRNRLLGSLILISIHIPLLNPRAIHSLNMLFLCVVMAIKTYPRSKMILNRVHVEAGRVANCVARH